MKFMAAILTITVLVYGSLIPFGNFLTISQISNQNISHEQNTPVEKLIESEASGSRIKQGYRSIVRVSDGAGRTVNIVLDSQVNLTYVKCGSSTIIRPPVDIRKKIDANLLNLTGLVTKNYLQNNHTNVILSMSNRTCAEHVNHWLVSTQATSPRKLYVSRNAYDQMHYFTACLNYSIMFKLARCSLVNRIWLDRRFKVSLDQSVDIIKDPSEWTAIESSYGRNINGSGIQIAILDTGIDSTHPDFQFPNGSSKITRAVSFTGEPTADEYGHGTHCASISAGTGAASAGQYAGVAPGAALLNVKVLDNLGEGLESWIISGIQWAVDNGADVLSMSFGEQTSSNGTDPTSMTVKWAAEQGSVCVVAAGNSGPETYTISNPGVAGSAITVGASSKSDTMTSFSSRGPTSDFRIKPDLVAPGADVIAARADGTSMGTPISADYTRASGTSMATPHVAGAVALLLDAHPQWNPTKVEMSLANYAEDLGANVLEQGSGRLNLCEAVNASVIGNSSISFGRAETNRTYTYLVLFQNLAETTISVTLNVEMWHIESQNSYQLVIVNDTSFYLSSHSMEAVEVTLDTNIELPSGHFEGRITAYFEDRSIRIPLFFCIFSQIKAEVIDGGGSTLMAVFSLINAQTGRMEAHSGETELANFIVQPGQYIVQAMNVYGWKPDAGTLDTKFSFIVHQTLSIGTDETRNLKLSLASAHKLDVRSTDITGSSLHLVLKQLLTPYYYMAYISEIGTLSSHHLYLTSISEYMTDPCYFGFAAFSPDDLDLAEPGALISEVDAYFIGWSLTGFGDPPTPTSLDYANSELATFDIDNLLPKHTPISTIWFNQITGIWQTGLWLGYETHPGLRWKTHILPYQYKNTPSASWAELEWSCIYASTTDPDESSEYFVIDRHFEPISKGENHSYQMGRTPLLPQTVYDNAPYYGTGMYIPYYPLVIDEHAFVDKSDTDATKRVEVFKDGFLINNSTILWSQQPVRISHFLNSHGHGLYTFLVKTQTSLDFSSRNIAQYVINYTSESTDIIPPSITRIDSATCLTGNRYPVNIQLDDNHEISNISLLYSLNNNPWTSQNLMEIGDNHYSADITISSSVQNLSLIVEATDRSGNSIRFTTQPAAQRGYQTQIDAALYDDTISGTLTVEGGSLLQPVYLRVKSGEEEMYILTDIEGNFGFIVPESMLFPMEIEMVCMGRYAGSEYIIGDTQIHNIAIIQIALFQTIVGNDLLINVTIANLGDYTENFNITVYANTSSIATRATTLPSRDTATINFTWNPTGFAKGNYTISAHAEPVSGEVDTADNTYVDGWVIVVLIGDITGPDGQPDGKCNMMDVGLVARYFGQDSPPAPPNCDVVYDGTINMKDVGMVARHFGETDP